ncbi:MAG TPA: hypothetical protein VFW91_21735 [Candidatus Binatia bacterium]|nr:hypothetical protein [Candidatus Binatia bacterium]
MKSWRDLIARYDVGLLGVSANDGQIKTSLWGKVKIVTAAEAGV